MSDASTDMHAEAPAGGSSPRKRESVSNSGALIRQAMGESFVKLSPTKLWHNPVMFVVEIGAAIVTFYVLAELLVRATSTVDRPSQVVFLVGIAFWLWFPVLFAKFAEAMAEGRGKAQADTLRKMKTDTLANLLKGEEIEQIAANQLRKGDKVVISAGETIPGDGDVIQGIASVDESAITGESAPVIRESGGDRSAVTGGTKVLSDWIKVRITSNPGETFLDRMIALVEGAQRQKTPNEIALSILLAGLTIVFLLVVVALPAYFGYSLKASGVSANHNLTLPVLISLLVCLIPTTIGGLLSAIGISGMDRLLRKNVIATSGKAIEAAGDTDVLLLDKTGTITLGNRMATEFIPAEGFTKEQLADAAQLASLADETPEGRSVVVLAKEQFNIRAREMQPLDTA